MNVNIEGADKIVAEYLIYRGFTQTLQTLEGEMSRDRTKKFEVSRIVETIFGNLLNFEIESFVLFWDFLNKRFFFHLDAEHFNLCCSLKADLLKFYLVHAVKTKNKDRVNEFFTLYSHEILSETGGSVASSLRNWFVLPYMDEPEKDNEFSVYFSTRWAELLKITLHNFLSIVLSSSPPPKLLLLEKWYRSEAQVEMRSQYANLSKKIEVLQHSIQTQHKTLHAYREHIKNLTSLLLKNNFNLTGVAAGGSGGLFDEGGAGKEREREEFQSRIRDLGSTVLKLSSELLHHETDATPTSGVGVGRGWGGAEEMEKELLNKLGDWVDMFNQHWK
eukprot:gene25262-30505_t